MDRNEPPKPPESPPIAPTKQAASKAPAFTVKPWESTFLQKGGRAGFSGKNHSTRKK